MHYFESINHQFHCNFFSWRARFLTISSFLFCMLAWRDERWWRIGNYQTSANDDIFAIGHFFFSYYWNFKLLFPKSKKVAIFQRIFYEIEQKSTTTIFIDQTISIIKYARTLTPIHKYNSSYISQLLGLYTKDNIIFNFGF